MDGWLLLGVGKAGTGNRSGSDTGRESVLLGPAFFFGSGPHDLERLVTSVTDGTKGWSNAVRVRTFRR
jgi:hypothetical protein